MTGRRRRRPTVEDRLLWAFVALAAAGLTIWALGLLLQMAGR